MIHEALNFSELRDADALKSTRLVVNFYVLPSFFRRGIH